MGNGKWEMGVGPQGGEMGWGVLLM